MTFIDVAARNAAAASVTQIGLATSSTVEVTGGGYVRLTPAWGGDGTLDAALAFSGPPNGGPVTHVILSNGTESVFRPVAVSKSFNSDGKVNLTSYDVTAALGA